MQRPPTTATTPGSARRLAPRVFVRTEALELHRPGDRRRGGRVAATRAPDADRALDTLSAFGYEVVILPAGASAIALAPRDWLLTHALEDCRGARRAGARTILVGTDASDHAGQPDRCDVAVGSVQGAALEVVIADPESG